MTGSLLEYLLESKKKDVPSLFTKKHPRLSAIVTELKTSGDKILKFMFSAATLGVLDSFGPRKYIDFAAGANVLSNFLPHEVGAVIPILTANGLYQTLLFAGDISLAAWSLHDKRWRKLRNMINLSMAIPHAVLMDYTSASIQEGTPYPFPLPQEYYNWRDSTFSQTIWNGVVQWVNEPSKLIPGAIQGYDLLLYVPIAYLSVQGIISATKLCYANKKAASTKV